MTTTDKCGCCEEYFQLQPDGTIRRHDDCRGNRCLGSGRWPALDVEGPWGKSA